MANGGTVCRSTACSTNGKCEPLGGCNVDADCAASKLVHGDERTRARPSSPTRQPVPTDLAPMAPTRPLNGICTASAGTLVCQSGVCDTKDNDCGYANGDGPLRA